MNTRDYKQCAPGEYYHIYNRGNAKDLIFRDEEDYEFFLLRLTQILGVSVRKNRWDRPLPPDSFSCIAYCLMPNHFHLLLRQNKDIPTSVLMTRVCTSYAIYFNKKYERVGHLFQDQFKQKNVQENEYLLWLSAYIHQNPVKAGMVSRAAEWQWSSMRGYASGVQNGLVANDIVLDQLSGVSYADWLLDKGSEVERHVAEAF